MVRLTKFISYNDCILRKGGHRNGHALNASELAKELGIPYSTFRKNFKKIQDNGIYIKHNKSIDNVSEDCIIANPDIFMRGSVVYPWVSKLFKDYIWRRHYLDANSSSLKHYLRKDILDWKKESMKICSYSCIITGLEFTDIHHLTPFQKIYKEAINNLGFDEYALISNCTESQYSELKDEVIKLHDLYGIGVCLNRDVHTLFHELYGYKTYIPNDFYDFIKRISNGEFDSWFNEKNIPIDINYKVINRIFGVEK